MVKIIVWYLFGKCFEKDLDDNPEFQGFYADLYAKYFLRSKDDK